MLTENVDHSTDDILFNTRKPVNEPPKNKKRCSCHLKAWRQETQFQYMKYISCKLNSYHCYSGNRTILTNLVLQSVLSVQKDSHVTTTTNGCDHYSNCDHILTVQPWWPSQTFLFIQGQNLVFSLTIPLPLQLNSLSILSKVP